MDALPEATGFPPVRTTSLVAIGRLAQTHAVAGPVKSVAIVGNQPLGPDAARAQLIDSCDLVVRVNGFRLDEKSGPLSVGRRCDVVVFNRGVRATPWFFEGYRERLYLMVEPARLHNESAQIPPWWPVDLGLVAVSNRDVVVPFNRRLGLDPVAKGHWATTGSTAIGLADMLFPAARLHVAGFSFLDAPDQASWAHAYGDSCIVGGEHRLINESAWLAGLLERDRATFHH